MASAAEQKRRRAQVGLESVKEKYFNLYDMAPVGYIVIGENELILESNLTASTLLGVAQSVLIGRSMSRFILPEDHDIYDQHRKQLFATGTSQVCEFRILRANRSPFWARMEATAAEDADGERVCRAVISDITERKRAEEERESLQDQFLQSRKMEAVGQLAGGVAHDFNNILTVITACVEILLADDSIRGESVEAVREIRDATERATILTRQLLAFGRRQVVLRRVFCLGEAIRDMSGMLRRLVPENVDLSFVWCDPPCFVRVDPEQMEQVIVNLVVNACDSMPHGGRLVVKCADIDTPPRGFPTGRYVALKISDTGTGIPSDRREHIFEPFFTTKEMGKGSGLGLSTVWGIVNQAGGTIKVESEEGKGSTFSVFLPQTDEAPENVKEKAGRVAETTIPRATETTILLVEDELSVRRAACRILERAGYRVLVAEDATSAIELLRRLDEPPHLVLSDMVMPGMSGRELAIFLARDQPTVRVILMSGYDEETARYAEIPPGIEFLAKPFTSAVLLEKIREALED